MGQSANSNRHASLDQKKARSAGRLKQSNPERNAIRDAQAPLPAKGETGGAFGKGGMANRKGAHNSQGEGGGGGGATPSTKTLSVGRSTRRTRKNTA